MYVLFCNIAWMKNYEGVNDIDKPKNGGSYVSENEFGNECYNFQDYNGKCYGFVMLYGDMNLEVHFKGVKRNQDILKDVLVVWVATNDINETRIVGWYKNATVYRQQQYQQAFTNENFDLSYNFVAEAKNCYLLPESERTFPIQRAAQTGRGTGLGRSNIWYAESSFAQTILIPKVLEYIENYNGKYANTVFTDEIINEVLEDEELSNDFQKLYDMGVKCLEQDNRWGALKYFNTAKLIKETPDLLFYIAYTLKSLCCLNRAILIYDKLRQFEENKVDILQGLIECYDLMGDREKTIKYCNELISILIGSKDDIEFVIYYHFIVFSIYISLRDEKKAGEVIDTIMKYGDYEEVKECVKEMQYIIKDEFDNRIY